MLQTGQPENWFDTNITNIQVKHNKLIMEHRVK